MNVETTKQELLDWIKNIHDENILLKLSVLKNESLEKATSFFSIPEGNHIEKASLKAEITREVIDIDQGNFIDHKDLKKKFNPK